MYFDRLIVEHSTSLILEGNCYLLQIKQGVVLKKKSLSE